jgi:hypothetical protein
LSSAPATASFTQADYNSIYNPKCPSSVYFNFEAGYSDPRSPNIQVNLDQSGEAISWDISPEGYNSDFDHATVFGAGMGYVINPWLRAEIDVNYRGNFHYEKFQTVEDSSLSVERTRHFNLDSKAVMANIFFDLGEFFPGNKTNFCCNGIYIDPYVTVGFGPAQHQVTDFHTEAPEAFDGENTAFAFLADEKHTEWAYQLGLGVNLRTNKRFAVGIGYRYFNGGEFQTNHYFQDTNIVFADADTREIADAFTPGLTTAWKGKLKTNELYANIQFTL